MPTHKEHTVLSNVEKCVDQTLAILGDDIRMGIPIGIGKPNQFVNAVYKRAVSDPKLKLTILTGLTLQRPVGKSFLEKRFLDPFVERHFDNYPDLEYELDRIAGRLPDNVRVIEFYFPAGKMINNRNAQRDYISTNYTHVTRDLVDRGINLIAQLVSPSSSGDHLSLSSNPDVTLDIAAALKDQKAVFVAQVNRNMPYMYGDAHVPINTFDFIIDNPKLDYTLFAPPKSSVNVPDYMIGLYASTLVKDGGELQVGIGALGDALIYGMLLRHQDNKNYQRIIDMLEINKKHGALISTKGGLSTFDKGLFGASEMLVDGFMHLIKHGIIKRKVYDHLILQRLLNEGKIQEDSIDKDILYHLITRGAIQAELSLTDFQFLQYFGVLKKELSYQYGKIHFSTGEVVNADLNQDTAQRIIIEKGLGDRLKNGALIHGAFFLGAKDFYEWLRNLTDAERKLIHMKSVQSINQLYGHEPLDRLHRINGRFFNSCLMMTLSGAAVSDGLENGQVISGVGGQYNFVAMAHALPDGHSVLQLRSTRTSRGKTSSNIVWNYGHVTIPRHLKDIVITEYGMADIRGKTDEEVIVALLKISDSRFQQDLIREAKEKGKLSEDYQLPNQYRNNLPEVLTKQLDLFKKEGLFPSFPFGSDFSPEEMKLGKALSALKNKTSTTFGKVSTITKAIFSFGWSKEFEPMLERMDLKQPKTFQERIYQRMLINELK